MISNTTAEPVPADLAAAAVFLASGQAAAITGQMLVVRRKTTATRGHRDRCA